MKNLAISNAVISQIESTISKYLRKVWKRIQVIPWVNAEDIRVAWFGVKEAERQPRCSLQLPEEGMQRRRCWSPLPGNQWQDVGEQHKAAMGEIQTEHQEKK